MTVFRSHNSVVTAVVLSWLRLDRPDTKDKGVEEYAKEEHRSPARQGENIEARDRQYHLIN